MKLKILLPIFFLATSIYAQTTQWASTVINYSSQLEQMNFAATQALGEPNSMPSKGYCATAWGASSDDRKEFIHVGFAKPMKAKMIVIAENSGPGAVTKVIAFEENGTEHEVYKARPDTLDLKSRYLYIKLQKTDYAIAALKISVDCRATPGENQIDAIGLADHEAEIISTIEVVSDIKFFSEAERLSNLINSKYAEIMPVISPDGNVLFITRKNYPPNHNDDEIWYSLLNDKNEWGKLVKLSEPLNNSNSNFVTSITPDGNSMMLGNQYFSGTESSGSGFSFSYKKNGKWEFPVNAKVKNYINTDRYVTFYLSNDGTKVFMSVRREDTRGESDIYVSFLQPDGSWSEPKNLGPDINSAGGECSPFLAADNTTLYFSSNGYNGYGSNDIYMSKRLDDSWTRWSKPLNMGKPLNSDGWDAYYTIPARGDYAYFTRNSDIYRIKLVDDAKPQPVILLAGKVINKKTNAPIPNAIIRYETLIDGKEAGLARSSDPDGTYKIVLPYGYNYGFRATASNFLPVSDNMDASDRKEYAEISKDLYMVPVEVGEVVRLNNVFFDFGKSTLRKESFSELDRMALFLKENAAISIELGGHTDNVGNENDNLVLSQQRTDAVMKYLSDKGISAARLKAVGHGEAKPLATNDSDEGRQVNRRVEFTIVKK